MGPLGTCIRKEEIPGEKRKFGNPRRAAPNHRVGRKAWDWGSGHPSGAKPKFAGPVGVIWWAKCVDFALKIRPHSKKNRAELLAKGRRAGSAYSALEGSAPHILGGRKAKTGADTLRPTHNHKQTHAPWAYGSGPPQMVTAPWAAFFSLSDFFLRKPCGAGQAPESNLNLATSPSSRPAEN